MTPQSRRRILWLLAAGLVIGAAIWWFWPMWFSSEPRYDRWFNAS